MHGRSQAGEHISVDQYKSSICGCRLETCGQEQQSQQYYGGTLFYDHASGCLFNYHQISLSAAETIEAFHALKREAGLCGVNIRAIHTDNGVFTLKAFHESLNNEQPIMFSGVGAHFQNGAAKANIGKVPLA